MSSEMPSIPTRSSEPVPPPNLSGAKQTVLSGNFLDPADCWTESDDLINEQLEKTKSEIRWVDFFGTLAALATVALSFALIGAVLDHWIFRYGLTVSGRITLAGIFAALLILLFLCRLYPICRYKLNPLYAADILEKSQNNGKNPIINWFLLKKTCAPKSISLTDASVLNGITAEALRHLEEMPQETVVDHSPIIRWGIRFTVVLLLFFTYLIVSPKSAVISIERIVLPTASIAPPLAIRFIKIEPGNLKTVQGEKIQFQAEIDGTRGKNVWLSWSTADGRLVNQNISMTRISDKIFSVEFPESKKGVDESFFYKIIVGDPENSENFSSTFSVDVRAALALSVEKIVLNYPEYTRLEPKTIEHSGEIKAVEGTKIHLTVTANAPLKSAEIVPGGNIDAQRSLTVDSQNPMSASISFELTSDANSEDLIFSKVQSYEIRGLDELDHKNPIQCEYALAMIPDQPPTADWDRVPDGRIELPVNKKIEFTVRAEDPDFGLSSARLFIIKRDIQGNEAGPSDTNNSIAPLELLSDQYKNKSGLQIVPGRIEPAQWQPKIGDEYEFWVEVADTKPNTPNLARTEKKLFVVTAPQIAFPQEEEKKDKDEKKNGGDQNRQDQNSGNENGQKVGEQGNESGSDQGKSPNDSQQKNTEGSPQNQEGGSEGKNGSGQESNDSGTGKQDPSQKSKEKNQGNDQNSQNNGNGNDENSSGNNSDGDSNNQNPQKDQNSGNQNGSDEKRPNESGQSNQNSNGQPPNSNDDGESNQEQGGAKPNRNQNSNGADSNQDPSADDSSQKGEKNSSVQGTSSSEPIDPESNPGDAFEKILEHQRKNSAEKKNSDPSREKNESFGGSAENDQSKEKNQSSENQNSAQNKNSGQDNPKSDPKNSEFPENAQSGKNQNDPLKDNEKTNDIPEQTTNRPEDPNAERKTAENVTELPKGIEREKGNVDPDTKNFLATDKKETGSEQQVRPDANIADDPEHPNAGTPYDPNAAGQQGRDKKANSPEELGPQFKAEASDKQDKQDKNKSTPPNNNLPELDPSKLPDQTGSGDSSNPTANLPGSKKSDKGEGKGRSAGGNGPEKSEDQDQKGAGGSGYGETREGPDALTAEDPNLKYTVQATELALSYIEEQLKGEPDHELLKSLGWTREQLIDFLDHWKKMQEKAKKSSPSSKEYVEYLETLHNIGLRAPSSRTVLESSHLSGKESNISESEIIRYRPPQQFKDRFRAYNQGISGSDKKN